MFHALNCVCRQGAQNFTCCCRKWHSNCNNWAKENRLRRCGHGLKTKNVMTVPILKGWSLQCNGKASFCEVNYLQMVPNGDEWQGKLILYITLICHRTEYHGSSCIWPAGSRCQETFMSQWLHWWLSSLYFVVSHKGICS